MGQYDVGMICFNGHLINDRVQEIPERCEDYCSRCGEKSLTACPVCKAPVRGYYQDDERGDYRKGEVWSHCSQCGKEYPWTERKAKALEEMIAEFIDLEAEEREKLKEAIPDIITETPKSDLAVLRYKNAIAKVGKVGGKALYDLVINVAGAAIASKFTG